MRLMGHGFGQMAENWLQLVAVGFLPKLNRIAPSPIGPDTPIISVSG